MIRLAKVLIALMLMTITPLSAQNTPFAPALMVNDDVVTAYDVEQRGRLYRLFGLPAALVEERVITDLTEEALMQQEARRLGISLNEAAIQDGLERFAQSRGTNISALRNQLARRGIDISTVEALVSSQLGWREAMRRRFAGRSSPSDLEVDETITLSATLPTREVYLAEIAIPLSERGVNNTRALVERLYQDLSRGGDFAAAARRYSRSGTARNAGIIGWVSVEDLPANMRAQVEALDVGGVSQPVPITRGVTLLKVLDARNLPASGASQVEVTFGRAVFSDEATARAARPAINSCTDFDGTIPRAIEASVIGPVALSDVDSALYSTIAQLSEGVVSQPVLVGSNGPSLIILCDRRANISPEERARVTDRLFSDRVSSFADGYMQDLQRNAVIERR